MATKKARKPKKKIDERYQIAIELVRLLNRTRRMGLGDDYVAYMLFSLSSALLKGQLSSAKFKELLYEVKMRKL